MPTHFLPKINHFPKTNDSLDIHSLQGKTPPPPTRLSSYPVTPTWQTPNSSISVPPPKVYVTHPYLLAPCCSRIDFLFFFSVLGIVFIRHGSQLEKTEARTTWASKRLLNLWRKRTSEGNIYVHIMHIFQPGGDEYMGVFTLKFCWAVHWWFMHITKFEESSWCTMGIW